MAFVSNHVLHVLNSTYDLSHLIDCEIPYKTELKNKQVVNLTLGLSYSCHCYSRKPLKGETFFPSDIVMDGKSLRIFSSYRYHLSKNLPRIFKELFDPNNYRQKVFTTQFHNLVCVKVLENGIDEVGEQDGKISYYIFFSLKKEGKKKISCFVESAYPPYYEWEPPTMEKPQGIGIAVRKKMEL